MVLHMSPWYFVYFWNPLLVNIPTCQMRMSGRSCNCSHIAHRYYSALTQNNWRLTYRTSTYHPKFFPMFLWSLTSHLQPYCHNAKAAAQESEDAWFLRVSLLFAHCIRRCQAGLVLVLCQSGQRQKEQGRQTGDATCGWIGCSKISTRKPMGCRTLDAWGFNSIVAM